MGKVTAYDLRYNLYALVLCILKRKNPEEAFTIIEGEKPMAKIGPKIDVDVEWLEELRRSGKTYREIQAITGYSYKIVYGRLNREGKRCG